MTTVKGPARRVLPLPPTRSLKDREIEFDHQGLEAECSEHPDSSL
jgi:hypothetical protein